MNKKIKYILMILILFYSVKVNAVQYDIVDLYLMYSDRGSYNSFPIQRITYDPNGRIYVVYQGESDGTPFVQVVYSDTDPNIWTEDDPNAIDSGLRIPSIAPYSEVTWKVSVSATNSAYSESPMYVQKNGSWGTEEYVDDDSPFPAGNSISQVMWDANKAWCCYRHASEGTYDNIECSARPDGGWVGGGGTQLATTYRNDSLSACMDKDSDSGNTLIWTSWLEYNTGGTGTWYINAASYLEGIGWSAASTISSVSAASATFGPPVIRNLDGTIVAMYYRNGVGTNTTFYQGMYAYVDANDAWTSPSIMTDTNYDNKYFTPFLNADNEICGMYNSNVFGYEVTYTCLSGGSWTEPTIVTSHAGDLLAVNVIVDQNNRVHFIVTDPPDEYYGYFDMTPSVIPAPQIISNIL